MKLVDIFENIIIDAQEDGDREKWLKAAAVALKIASRKHSKRLAEAWTAEAVDCIAEADPESEKEFDNLFKYSVWKTREEVINLFERKYLPLDELDETEYY
jgi:hypothetical protein